MKFINKTDLMMFNQMNINQMKLMMNLILMKLLQRIMFLILKSGHIHKETLKKQFKKSMRKVKLLIVFDRKMIHSKFLIMKFILNYRLKTCGPNTIELTLGFLTSLNLRHSSQICSKSMVKLHQTLKSLTNISLNLIVANQDALAILKW